jgi:carbon monoxide dehydrogenase subunit G
MTQLLADHLVLQTPRKCLWDILRSPERLARVLPGCEELHAVAPNTYEGTFKTRVQFLTLRARATARLCDLHPPDRLRLELDGRPLGLVGSFVVSVLLDLEDDGRGTVVGYAMDLEATGRLASFGTPLLRDTARRQVLELVQNLEQEIGREQAEEN